MSHRKKPMTPRRPFYVQQPEIARALHRPPADTSPLQSDEAGADDADDTRDWVEKEEDAFLEKSPSARGARNLRQSGVPRSMISLATQRITAASREGELDASGFRKWLLEPSDGGESVVDILTRCGAFREDRYSLLDVPDPERRFCPVELHMFYITHRWTPVDEHRATYREHTSRSAELCDDLRGIARELRLWAAPLANFAPRAHTMPDEMRRELMRLAGATEPKLHKGWLDWFADWLNEAAFHLQSAPLRRDKEAAFQLAWHREATRRSENADVLWEVGRRLFLLAFPSDRSRYTTADDYRRIVQARLG